MLRRVMKRSRSLPKPLAQSKRRNWQRLRLPQSCCLCDYSRHLHSQAMLSVHIIKMLLSPKGAVGDIKSKKSVNSHPRIVPAQIHILCGSTSHKAQSLWQPAQIFLVLESLFILNPWQLTFSWLFVPPFSKFLTIYISEKYFQLLPYLFTFPLQAVFMKSQCLFLCARVCCIAYLT